MADLAEFLGGSLAHALLLSIVYAGVGNTDRPFLRSATLNGLLTALTVLLAGLGKGDNGTWNFDGWQLRLSAGVLVVTFDLLRLRGRRHKISVPRDAWGESAHRHGILWVAISALACIGSFVVGTMLEGGQQRGLSSIFVAIAAVSAFATLTAYPLSRLIGWARRPVQMRAEM